MSKQPSRRETTDAIQNINLMSTVIPIILFFLCGLFAGLFTVGIIQRKAILAIALAGPLIFSTAWIIKDWNVWRNRHFAYGAFAIGYSVTLLALREEP